MTQHTSVYVPSRTITAVRDYISTGCGPFRTESQFFKMAANIILCQHDGPWFKFERDSKPGKSSSVRPSHVSIFRAQAMAMTYLIATGAVSYKSRCEMLHEAAKHLLEECRRRPSLEAWPILRMYDELKDDAKFTRRLEICTLFRCLVYFGDVVDDTGGPICCRFHRKIWLPSTRFTSAADYPKVTDFSDQDACRNALASWTVTRWLETRSIPKPPPVGPALPRLPPEIDRWKSPLDFLPFLALSGYPFSSVLRAVIDRDLGRPTKNDEMIDAIVDTRECEFVPRFRNQLGGSDCIAYYGRNPPARSWEAFSGPAEEWDSFKRRGLSLAGRTYFLLGFHQSGRSSRNSADAENRRRNA